MRTLFALSLGLFLFACSDYPTKDENNPTEITVNIVNESINNNDLNDPSDNVTSESNSNSDANSNSKSSNVDNNTLILDNVTR